MLDWPAVKRFVDKIVASVFAFKLAAHWPPVELLLELDANAIHGSFSFLPFRTLRLHGLDTTKTHRFS
jgi:hypothetical protein